MQKYLEIIICIAVWQEVSCIARYIAPFLQMIINCASNKANQPENLKTTLKISGNRNNSTLYRCILVKNIVKEK